LWESVALCVRVCEIQHTGDSSGLFDYWIPRRQRPILGNLKDNTIDWQPQYTRCFILTGC